MRLISQVKVRLGTGVPTLRSDAPECRARNYKTYLNVVLVGTVQGPHPALNAVSDDTCSTAVASWVSSTTNYGER